jgi:hypothetical protein
VFSKNNRNVIPTSVKRIPQIDLFSNWFLKVCNEFCIPKEVKQIMTGHFSGFLGELFQLSDKVTVGGQGVVFFFPKSHLIQEIKGQKQKKIKIMVQIQIHYISNK